MKKIKYGLGLFSIFYSLFVMACDNQGFVRAVPKGAHHSAAYLTVSNDSESDLTLTKVSTPIAKEVQLHTVIDDKGTAFS